MSGTHNDSQGASAPAHSRLRRGLRWLLLLVVVAALLVWLISKALKPMNYGIDARVYEDAGRESKPVESIVSRINPAMGKRPNFVVILADDLGWGDLKVQGSRAIESPRTDDLAAKGMRFTNFYASASVCSPSRASLLTGRYPLRSGFTMALPAAEDTFLRSLSRGSAVALAKLNIVDMAGGDGPVQGLPRSEITLPEALKVAGYRTMGIGKWHLGDFTKLPQYHPSEHGFDRFVGFNMANDDWPVAFWRDKQQVTPDIGIDQQPYTRIFTEEAVKFIEESREQPFFLYLAHKDPHQPFFPSERFAGKSAAGPYGDAVAEFDWSVGEVTGALERLGLLENTLVIVTSDNGPWFEGSPGGLRGRKGQSYEGGFRVPFIALWPGHIPANVVNETPAMNIDIFPTLLALAGVSLPADRVIDGVNLGPVLLSVNGHLDERSLYFYKDYDIEAVRAGQWKYLDRNSHYTWPAPLDKPGNSMSRMLNSRDYHPPGSDVSVPTLGVWPLLYDLNNDPEEAYNIAKLRPEVVTRLKHNLDGWRAEFLKNPRGWRLSGSE